MPEFKSLITKISDFINYFEEKNKNVYKYRKLKINTKIKTNENIIS